MIKFIPTTPMFFYVKVGGYTSGTGATVTWTKILPTSLYGEWKGGYGDRALAAEAIGVKDMATIRTYYVPSLYEYLQKSQVVVIKNADAAGIVSGVPVKSNPNVYELWGGVDNVEQANQFIEFRVRRYEGK